MVCLKAICPKDENHNEFITVAHVMQDWKVDSEGNWLDTIDESVEVSFKPNPDNIWTCAICGTEANVK